MALDTKIYIRVKPDDDQLHGLGFQQRQLQKKKTGQKKASGSTLRPLTSRRGTNRFSVLDFFPEWEGYDNAQIPNKVFSEISGRKPFENIKVRL